MLRKIVSFTILVFIFIIPFTIVHAKTFQTSDNRFISYTDVGHGRPIVLIHAFPTDNRLFELTSREIETVNDSKVFRIISIDLSGFGNSSLITENGEAITMSDYASELNELLAFLKIQSAVIGGESMGGYVALAFLDKFPNKVEGLILSSTQAIADSPETKEKREATAIDVMENGTEKLIKDFMTKALSPNAPETTKLFLQYILEKQDNMAVASALRGMALRTDTSHLLANSSLPILIMAGEDDAIISPSQSQNMHVLAKNSKLVIFPHTGHLASMEQPNKWINEVIDMFYQI